MDDVKRRETSAVGASKQDVAEMEAETLVEEYHDLVMAVVHRIYNQHSSNLPFEDAVEYGFEGLLQAWKRYDPDRATKFGSFAYHRIRGAVYDGIEECEWSSGRRGALPERPGEDSLLESEGDPPSLGEENSGSWSALIRRLEESTTQTYLIGPRDVEMIEDPEERDDPFGARRELLEKVREGLDGLAPDARSAVVLYYFDNLSMSEVAEAMESSKGWISRLMDRAIEQLRESVFREAGGDSDSPLREVG